MRDLTKLKIHVAYAIDSLSCKVKYALVAKFQQISLIAQAAATVQDLSLLRHAFISFGKS